MALKNDTYIKSSMIPQAYKVVITHAHETPGWNIMFRILHEQDPNIGGMYGDFKSELSTLVLNQG